MAKVFSKQDLPNGFKYPLAFLKLMEQEPVPYYEPWYFINEFPDNANFWNKEIKEQYPSRVLVPFAKWEDTDDVVCFDGTDISGNPRVYFVHTYASPGWEDRGYLDNFEEWLKQAKEESAEYLAERALDLEDET